MIVNTSSANHNSNYLRSRVSRYFKGQALQNVSIISIAKSNYLQFFSRKRAYYQTIALDIDSNFLILKNNKSFVSDNLTECYACT